MLELGKGYNIRNSNFTALILGIDQRIEGNYIYILNGKVDSNKEEVFIGPPIDIEFKKDYSCVTFQDRPDGDFNGKFVECVERPVAAAFTLGGWYPIVGKRIQDNLTNCLYTSCKFNFEDLRDEHPDNAPKLKRGDLVEIRAYDRNDFLLGGFSGGSIHLDGKIGRIDNVIVNEFKEVTYTIIGKDWVFNDKCLEKIEVIGDE